MMLRSITTTRQTTMLTAQRIKYISVHRFGVLRFFNTETPNDDARTTKNHEEHSMANKKLWDKVLRNHQEQYQRQNGDVLYDYHRKRYFGMLSAGSLAHIAFWSWFKGYEESLYEMMPAVSEPNFISFITNDTASTIGFGSSILLSFLIGFHAMRAVARISVVAGGQKLRITTHKFFGDLAEPFDVPIANVSANPNTSKNIILKVGKDRGFYLVDVHGQFYNREKLERLITFRTDFSEHDKMIVEKEKAKYVEVRTDLPRTNLESNSPTRSLPKKIAYKAKKSPSHPKGNLLGRKTTITNTRKSGPNRTK